jgi:hypothetical protein
MGITSWNTCRGFHGKQHATDRNGISAWREPALERLVCHGFRDGCCGRVQSPSSGADIPKRISQISLPEEARVALVVLIMALGFSGVLVSTLLNLPGTLKWTAAVLFATALLCSGFVALVGWFAVSGASSRWF